MLDIAQRRMEIGERKTREIYKVVWLEMEFGMGPLVLGNQGDQSPRRCCTHFFDDGFHTGPATQSSASIVRSCTSLSHIPQLRQSGDPCFHRRRRARRLMRGFARRHDCAQPSV